MGKHSNQCYLDAMQGAFESFAGKAGQKGIISPGAGECVTDFVDHLLFHIPYPRMVEYASAQSSGMTGRAAANGKTSRLSWEESRRLKSTKIPGNIWRLRQSMPGPSPGQSISCRPSRPR